MSRPLRAAAILAVVGAAAAFFVGRVLDHALAGSFDIYSADLPNLVYLRRALATGEGLLWNRLQNCGQPWYPSTLVGLFYLPRWLVVPLDLGLGIQAIAVLHLLLAGVFAYVLARSLDAAPAPALCAAFLYEVSGASALLGGWLPQSLLGIYAFLPAALWRCERALQHPTGANGLWLGVVLTLILLPGYPQLLLYAYVMVAWRAGWAILEPGARGRRLGAVALGLALPVALGAVQLLPMIEFARLSVRHRRLELNELSGIPETWTLWRERFRAGLIADWSTVLLPAPLVLAGFGLVRPGLRRTAWCYGTMGALFMAIACDGPLFRLSRALPFGSSFREPHHALVGTMAAMAVLAAVGAEAIARAAAASPPPRALLAAGAVLGAALAWHVFGVRTGDEVRWATVGLVALAALAAGAPLPGRRAAGVVLAVAALWATVHANQVAPIGFTRDAAELWSHAHLFTLVRERATPQDRVHQVGYQWDYGLKPKSASVFDVPSITDYEPQTSQRYADYRVRMMFARRFTMALFTFQFRGEIPRLRPLLDLAAARFLLIDPEATKLRTQAELEARMGGGLELLAEEDGVRLYENHQALSRAYFVPRLAVVPAWRVLAMLATREVDPRAVALVESPPADGFTGAATPATGRVVALEDHSERVSVEVEADGPGFLVLSDQLYPGWSATVDGEAVPIERANYVFRAVRVPAGRSTVVFRYRPWSVLVGAAVSLATLAALGAFAWRRRAPAY